MSDAIQTERLLIRPWSEEDAAAIEPVYCDPEVRRFTGGVLTDEERATFVPRRLERRQRGELMLEPVIEKATGAMVGVCGLQPLAGGPEIEIGWMLARAHWGKGYAAEAARGVLEHAHRELGLARIVATIQHANTRSIAVANRLGMHFVRVIRVYKRDMLCYESTRG